MTCVLPAGGYAPRSSSYGTIHIWEASGQSRNCVLGSSAVLPMSTVTGGVFSMTDSSLIGTDCGSRSNCNACEYGNRHAKRVCRYLSAVPCLGRDVRARRHSATPVFCDP